MRINRGLWARMFCLVPICLMTTASLGQNRVVVVPLGKDDGVYARISGTWSGMINFAGGSYTALLTIIEDAKVGEVAGQGTYRTVVGQALRCTTVLSRISENGNSYSFNEVVVTGEGCASDYTISHGYNPTDDTLTFDPGGPETGTLSRLTQPGGDLVVTAGTGQIGQGVSFLDGGFGSGSTSGGRVHSPSGGPDLFFQAGDTPTFPGVLSDFVEYALDLGGGILPWEGAEDGPVNWMKVIRDGDGAVSWALFEFEFAPGTAIGDVFVDIPLYVTRADGADFTINEAIAAADGWPL